MDEKQEPAFEDQLVREGGSSQPGQYAFLHVEHACILKLDSSFLSPRK